MKSKNKSQYINHIFCEDCTETMINMVKDGFKVDTIITSPPYNTVREGNYYSTQESRDRNIGRYDVYIESQTDSEYIQWTLDLFKLFDKILKRNGVILYNLSYGSENTELMWRVVYNILEYSNFTIGDNIIWKKETALPNAVSHNKLTRICEYIFVFCRKDEIATYNSNKQVSKTRANGQIYYHSKFNFINAPNNDGVCKLNKATFSTDLVLQLLDFYVSKGSIVYDPFMGTGTTANACKIKGLTYVGSEISQAQCDYAKERLSYSTLNEWGF